jgi:tRNA threonylcarbamoyl adenosine modification protein YjeE
LDLSNEQATWRLAEDIAAVLGTGDLVTLSGDLGAGKTSLARAMVRGATGDPLLEVPSPTFAIRIDYQASHLQIAHMDLYRISSEEEAEELGVEEALDNGAVIVEWPDRIALPDVPDRLDIAIAGSGDRRQVTLRPGGTWPARLQRSQRIRALLDRSGYAECRRMHVVGDASAKAFERVITPGGDTAILMNSPARTPGPAVWEGRSYDEVAHRALDVVPFLAIGSALAAAGIHVPEVIASDISEGLVLMEDLGGDGIADDRGEPITERYEAAIDLLAAMHGRDWPESLTVGEESYRVPPYDTDALLIETTLLADWFVPHTRGPHARGQGWSPAERAGFIGAWRSLINELDDTSRTWVMRDFHSPNILWQADADGLDRVGVIDIQDTLVGHPAYDVASLAQDARVDIGPALEDALVARYCAARTASGRPFDRAGFDAAYAILGAQRATKVLGAFTRLAFHDGRTGYAAHIPRVKNVLARNLKHPVLSDLQVWYADLL